MSLLKNEIEKACKFIINYSNMDTIFIDPKSNIILEYAYKKVPEALSPYFENSVNMLNLHEQPSKYDVLFHSNSYKLNFISARIHDGTDYLGSIIVGPYLLEEPTNLMIETIISENNLSISLNNIINQYYLSLPLISTYKAKIIAEFLGYITSNIHSLCSQSSKIGYITYNFKTEYSIWADIIKKNTELSMDSIEKRYSDENILLYAIETANKELLDKIANKDSPLFIKTFNRFPNDPLRSYKNISIVLNSLFRKAAEKGGVHPIYIDSISEKFAIQIEKAASIQKLSDLRYEMLYDYYNAVRKLSLKNFSHLIRKAIEFIRIHLNQDLSLETISNSLHSSSYQLSRQFKKETGENITEYITKQRINVALSILENKSVSITDVAYMVGFNDANYFTRVFKQIKGITPSEYRKSKN